MAEGQRNKKAKDEDRGISLLNKNVEETTRANLERTEAEKLAARTPAELDVELDEAFAQMDANDAKQQLRERRGIASDLKDLSKRGALTGDLLKEARQRATEAGVSESQFDTFLEGNRIRERGSPFSFKKAKTGTGLFDQPAPDPTAAATAAPTESKEEAATAAPTESKEEAAQNVMFQRQYGTGLGTLAAMQDPNYELGSGSALRQPARSIGPASGKFRRAARRLRRQGYGAAAQQMAAAGEMARMNEPSIDTPALRGQRIAQRIAAGREARKQDTIMAGATGNKGVSKPEGKSGVLKKARGKSKEPIEEPSDQTGIGRNPVRYNEDGQEMMINPMQTQEFRDANGNGIEDRSEGIYRESDYIIKPKNWGKTKAL